ncbi:DUF1648 domain-containing protein [Streptomyces sp. MNP-20]|uniref:DUF1648 domain-containing protein n=1 Tax=Streptomyces sp. MNP-20 TaxID=2721165 RepID=UPI002815C89C|nr:DUF1648 domain-containing protein [Streptomyces sp. MNP-20]
MGGAGADRGSGRRPWGALGASAAPLLLLLALPLAAAHRLPDRLATHWSGGSARPDDSLPLWAATLFPALIWAVLAGGTLLAGRRADTWRAAVLLPTGVALVGAQAAIVRANVDRADWRDAESAPVWGVAVAVAAVAAAVLGVLLSRRRAPDAPPRAAAPHAELAPGEPVDWVSRTSSPWMHALAAVFGAGAVAAAVVTVAGLTDPLWALAAPFALVAVACLVCASVEAAVTREGLRVTFGPLGRPVRRWAPETIETAYAEHRTPGQVGGWGYRLSGLGTTVMLRAGECLVVRAKGKAFAVSVDDAERGAALLNALNAVNAPNGSNGPNALGARPAPGARNP